MNDRSLTPWQLLTGYLVALLAMAVLDGVWLGLVATDFYRREMGPLMADPVQWLPAVAFYLLYPLGLVYLGLNDPQAAPSRVAWRCAAIGLLAYGTYDLTNLATVRGWSPRLAALDMAWGTCASAASGAAAQLLLRSLARRRLPRPATTRT